MPRYQLQLIRGDGSRQLHQHCLSDPRTAWEHIFVMARTCGAPGSQFQVLDECGEVVIRVGVATATAFARMRERVIPRNGRDEADQRPKPAAPPAT